MHSLDRAPLSRRKMLTLAAATSAASVTGLAAPAWAITTQEKIVDLSRLTIEEFLSDPDLADFQKFMKGSKGIMIFPQLFKGGFILGAEGGNGVYLVKGSDGTWSPPAFYTFAAGSIGLQIGGQVSQAVFTVMNEKTVESMIGGQFKMGADASVAIGPIGAGTGASTTTDFKFDIYSFSKTVGLFGGGALDGAGLIVNEDYNKDYYGTAASSRDNPDQPQGLQPAGGPPAPSPAPIAGENTDRHAHIALCACPSEPGAWARHPGAGIGGLAVDPTAPGHRRLYHQRNHDLDQCRQGRRPLQPGRSARRGAQRRRFPWPAHAGLLRLHLLSGLLPDLAVGHGSGARSVGRARARAGRASDTDPDHRRSEARHGRGPGGLRAALPRGAWSR